MAEYSRLASGMVTSTGVQTAVVLPFIPDFIEISNRTRAVAGAGVTRAWWETDMGQGAAFLNTFGTGDQFIAPVGGTSSGALVSGTGFTTIKAGLALQYGPTVFLGASGGIVSTSATVTTITTTTAHGLTTGNWVVFQNLYETTTTGMQQFAGIPFMVTVTGPEAFTINWNASGGNYTAITAGGLNTLASFKQILYPVLYAPEDSYISSITATVTNGFPTTTITTTAPSNFVVGQEVGFRIPASWGTIQLNQLPNVQIPGSPKYGYVVAVTNSTTFVVGIDSTLFTAFNPNQTFASFPGLRFPQVFLGGDVNTGGLPISAGSQLYPSPQVFNGFTSSTTIGVNTINGPAIQGAYINATLQGFVVGSSISGTVGDILYWRAYMSDINYPQNF